MVHFERSQMSVSSSCRIDRVWASSAAKGSSISKIGLRHTSARAICTRCFIPPESSAGNLSSWPERPTSSMYSIALARRSDFFSPSTRRPNSTFSTAVSHEYSESSPWKMTIRSRAGPFTFCPSTRTTPALAVSNPARRLITVVFPQPDGPSRRWNSPFGIARSKSRMIHGRSRWKRKSTFWNTTSNAVRPVRSQGSVIVKASLIDVNAVRSDAL